MAYERCRTLGHSWDLIPVTRPAPFGATLDLRCTHCATIRRDIIQPHSGRLLSRAYQHPIDYRDTGPDRYDREQWRAAWLATLDLDHDARVTPIRARRRRPA